MTLTLEGQAIAFLGAIVVGLALGLVYDLIRPFRLHAPQWKEWLLDFSFWIIVTLTVFFCAPLLENGQIRIYMLIAYCLGALVYFKLLSKPIRRLCLFISRLWQRVCSILLWPFRKLCSILSAPLSLFRSWLLNSLKKIFSFVARWFRIRKVPKKARSAAQEPSRPKEGQQHEGQPVYHQKGWSAD